MAETTSGRLLALLSLLQSHRSRSGSELAERLGVTPRTVRRDVDRLRELGYPVHATQGAAGYRLGSGAAMPPLLLDDEEAVAVVVALRTAVSVGGIEEASERALAKLEQVLPSRLRQRVHTLDRATVRAGAEPGPTVSADALMAIADACRRREVLRIDYTGAHGEGSVRRVEPHTLVSFGRLWYLVAFDLEKDDWRTFRVDRLRPFPGAGPRFPPRVPPHGDAVAYLSHRLSSQVWPQRAVVRLHEAVEVVAERVWPGMGVLEAVDEYSCLLHLGAQTLQDLAWMVTSTHTDFTLVEGPEGLADAFQVLARRLDPARSTTGGCRSGAVRPCFFWKPVEVP